VFGGGKKAGVPFGQKSSSLGKKCWDARQRRQTQICHTPDWGATSRGEQRGEAGGFCVKKTTRGTTQEGGGVYPTHQKPAWMEGGPRPWGVKKKAQLHSLKNLTVSNKNLTARNTSKRKNQRATRGVKKGGKGLLCGGGINKENGGCARRAEGWTAGKRAEGAENKERVQTNSKSTPRGNDRTGPGSKCPPVTRVDGEEAVDVGIF